MDSGAAVLGLESSCDETAAAVLRADGTILAEAVLSQLEGRRRMATAGAAAVVGGAGIGTTRVWSTGVEAGAGSHLARDELARMGTVRRDAGTGDGLAN